MDRNLDFLGEIVPDMNNIPGGVYDETSFSFDIDLKKSQKCDKVYIFDDAIEMSKINFMKDFFPKIGKYSPVSIQGMVDINNIGVGSERITAFMPNVAKLISNELKNNSWILEANDYTPTDWHQMSESNKWEFVGISPMIRFMKYSKGGKHFPHYDAGFIYPQPNNEYRTLYSFILYLTTNSSGSTRFIHDGQENIKIQERNHDDWSREANDEEVYLKVLPKIGRIVIFPHRLCHDVEEFTDVNSERIIIRGDILFKSKK